MIIAIDDVPRTFPQAIAINYIINISLPYVDSVHYNVGGEQCKKHTYFVYNLQCERARMRRIFTPRRPL